MALSLQSVISFSVLRDSFVAGLYGDTFVPFPKLKPSLSHPSIDALRCLLRQSTITAQIARIVVTCLLSCFDILSPTQALFVLKIVDGWSLSQQSCSHVGHLGDVPGTLLSLLSRCASVHLAASTCIVAQFLFAARCPQVLPPTESSRVISLGVLRDSSLPNTPDDDPVARQILISSSPEHAQSFRPVLFTFISKQLRCRLTVPLHCLFAC